MTIISNKKVIYAYLWFEEEFNKLINGRKFRLKEMLIVSKLSFDPEKVHDGLFFS